MQVRKQQLEPYMEPYTEPYMEQLTASKSGKEYDKAVYCHLAYFTYIPHVKCQVDEAQAGITTARRNVNNLIYADDTILMAESEEELKGLLMKALFLVSEITTNSDCSHEIKRQFFLGRKAMTNLESTLKGRDITLPTKVHIVKAMVFPVVMHGCESLTIKKAEH